MLDVIFSTISMVHERNSLDKYSKTPKITRVFSINKNYSKNLSENQQQSSRRAQTSGIHPRFCPEFSASMRPIQNQCNPDNSSGCSPDRHH